MAFGAYRVRSSANTGETKSGWQKSHHEAEYVSCYSDVAWGKQNKKTPQQFSRHQDVRRMKKVQTVSETHTRAYSRRRPFGGRFLGPFPMCSRISRQNGRCNNPMPIRPNQLLVSVIPFVSRTQQCTSTIVLEKVVCSTVMPCLAACTKGVGLRTLIG